MKNITFLIVTCLTLTILLSGCNIAVTPANDEDAIRSVIQKFALALNDQDWNEAKSYCVYESERYYAICQMEDMVNTLYSYCNLITINVLVDIYDVSVNGNYGQVYGHVVILLTACGAYESTDAYGYYYLQKVGNNWKIYESGL